MPKRSKVWEDPNFVLPESLTGDFIDDVKTVINASIWEGGSPGYSPAEKHLEDQMLYKYVSSQTASPENRQLSAILKWLEAEQRNARTNQRLMFDNAVICGIDMNRLVQRASRIVRDVIGECPPSEYTSYFTNGASTRLSRRPYTSALKFSGEAHSTRPALKHFYEVLDANRHWRSYTGFSIVNGSVMFTVPKNAEIDRVACKEPEVNMYLQRSVGLYLRDQLRKKCRIDLRDQSRNRNLARTASARFGTNQQKIATMDLSSASDLISTQLIVRLLPFDWFSLMDDLRVKAVELPDGRSHQVEMFSSMGNGFTFELETLVFYALSCAVNSLKGIRGPVSVYGDDIVVPSRTAKILGKVFAWFGFRVNSRKSFVSGPFRESCGGHYHMGIDVTPFYLRKPLERVSDLILALNLWRSWVVRTQVFAGAFAPAYYDLWVKYSKYVPRELQGGYEDDSPYALVTPGRPRFRLAHSKRDAVPEDMRATFEKSAYMRWLHDTTYREVRAPVNSERTIFEAFVTSLVTEDGAYTMRRNPQRDGGVTLFAQEIAKQQDA